MRLHSIRAWAGALINKATRPFGASPSAETALPQQAVVGSAPRFWHTRTVAIGVGVFGLGGLSVAMLVLWLALSPVIPLLEGIPFSPMVLDRQGQLLRMGLTADEKFRVRVSLPEIAPYAVQALLLYEDRYYYSHPGVNPLALGRAVLSMLWGERRMGGSTITMQVARLRFGLDTTSIGGKVRQMLLALRLEWQYSKQEILEAYFCLAPYGGNIEGIAAAARIYFQRQPAQLTLAECLALTSVPQNPVRRSPLTGRDFVAARERMERLWASNSPQTVGTSFVRSPDSAGRPDRKDSAALLPPKDGLAPLRIMGPASLPFEAPHVSAALLAPPATLVINPAGDALTPPQPDTDTDASAPPTVFHTTLSLAQQKLLEDRLAAFVGRGRIYGLHNAAAMLLHWPSMEIRALVGSARFNDARILGQVDGTLARRSPGSTLKPFIYALAMEQGLIHPQTLLVDSPRSFGGYDPENFDRTFRGPLPAHEALRTSRNIPAIWLASRLSPDLYTFLRSAGIVLPYSANHYGLSLVLGGAEVSMRELVELYAMLPNKGLWRPARLLRTDTSFVARSLLSPEVAVLALRMLEEPGRDISTRRGVFPHRYKTGTSNRFRDAWTVGVVGPYILAVWVGNFDNSPNPLLVGGEVAAPLYEDIAQALSLREAFSDPVPNMHTGLNIIRMPVCTNTGDIDISLCRNTTETWYIPGRSPTRASGVYRTILVDTRTGLRACLPSEYTREEVWEFWPTDLQDLFARAGLAKPNPPPFGPECASVEGDGGEGSDLGAGGSPPRILSPRDGVVYQRRVGDEHSGRNAIPLSAGVDADAGTLFWFVDNRFVGSSAIGETVMWQPEGGTHAVRVVDNLGRASTRLVRVETLP